MPNKLASEAALDIIRERYFLPVAPLLDLDGSDGVTRVFDPKTDVLQQLLFPVRYSSTPSADASITLHEMGHFVSLNPNRIVREGFGLGGGLPDLSFHPWERISYKPYSAKTEAMAIAWEIIVARDLFDEQLDPRAAVEALAFSNDFLFYEGKTDAEKFDWVADIVRENISLYGTIDDFDRLWFERCARLPQLFRDEDIRRTLSLTSPLSTEILPDINEDWNVQLFHFKQDHVEEFHVELTHKFEPTFGPVYECFQTQKGAFRWLQEIRDFYVNNMTEEMETSSSPGL